MKVQSMVRFCKSLGSTLRKFWLPLLFGLVCGVLVIEGLLALLVSAPHFTKNLNPSLIRIGQMVYRFSQHIPVYLYGRHDAILGYRNNEGSYRFSTSEFDTTLTFNSHGLRSPEEALQAPEIIFVGDSVTMGVGVEGDETFAHLVAHELGWRGLNTGVSSYGTVREMELLRQLDTSALRWIVLQHHANDAAENLAFYNANGTLSVMSKENFAKLSEREQSRKQFRWMPHLRAFIRGHIEGRRLGLGKNVPPEEEVIPFLFALEGITNHLPERARLLLIDTGGHGEYSPVFGNLVVEKVRNGSYPQWIESLTFVDLSEVMSPEDGYVLDSHPNVRGHSKIALEIVKAIRARESEESVRRNPR